MRTPDELVRAEVYYCVSTLVSDLMKIQEHLDYETQDALMELAETPPDYEEAAKEEGWAKYYSEDRSEFVFYNTNTDEGNSFAASWSELCDSQGIDTDSSRREVYEHWLISGWLADKLREKGEAVCDDLMGLTVWGRSTTGQSIAIDRVIEQICRELNAS
ncbi:MAG: hypothetical protein EOM21_15975 [Gammaproteobacteria bacterium]|nr:hypothetical protein [Gammaproteobacteria bacterium]